MVRPSAKEEMEKVESQLDKFESTVNALTLDRMNEASLLEVEPQTKLSQNELNKAKDIYLKPSRSIGSRENFNEDYREDWNHAKEFVQFIAENYEIIGETIELWTKPFAGVPCEFWQIPANKPVWGPRHLAEQISRCKYHRLKSEEKAITHTDGTTFIGGMVVDHTIQRLDAKPVIPKTRVFMGARSF